MNDEATRRDRARLRRDRCTLTRTTPDHSPPPAPTTPAERLALMWPLARESWLLSGRPLPDYPRHQIPGRVIRRDDPR